MAQRQKLVGKGRAEAQAEARDCSFERVHCKKIKAHLLVKFWKFPGKGEAADLLR